VYRPSRQVGGSALPPTGHDPRGTDGRERAARDTRAERAAGFGADAIGPTPRPTPPAARDAGLLSRPRSGRYAVQDDRGRVLWRTVGATRPVRSRLPL
jgi:hypothetical protein